MNETVGDVPLSIFVSYSHQDEAHRKRLETQLALLRRDGRIALWHDRRIRAGEVWAERISDHLETADVVLLLVSADFLASDYACEIEMRRALERHGDGVARVVPIVIKPCDWQDAPIGSLQALPRDGRAVTSWDDPAQFVAFDPNHKPWTWKGVSQEELGFHPVVEVSWKRAIEFCTWLEERFSWARGARLPTEEEWEYACRAGAETLFWSGDARQDLERVGWYRDNAGGRTHRVGEKPANNWGLFDVHGNVWEWTLSPWTNDYSKKSKDIEIDPSTVSRVKLTAVSGDRVMRGGSYGFSAYRASAAFRVSEGPTVGIGYRGFRVLLPPDPAVFHGHVPELVGLA